MMDKREKREFVKKSEAVGIILNLMLMVFAVGFMIGMEAGVVSAEESCHMPGTPANGMAECPEEEGGSAQSGEDDGALSGLGTVTTVAQTVIKKKPAVTQTPVATTGSSAPGALANLPEGTPIPKGYTSVTNPDGTINLLKNGATDNTLTQAKWYQKLYQNPGTFTASTGGSPALWGVGQGILWAGIAYALVPIIGDLLGLEQGTIDALQPAVSAGLFTAGTIRGLGAGEGAFGTGKGLLGTIGAHPFVAGIVVGVIVFVLTYKETEYRTVDFNCQLWEAPIGGDDCEKCNDGLHACTEYRCKSLGQACELENVGTEEERCFWKNPKDVKSPIIKPWESILTEGYDYTTLAPRPPGGGTVIKAGNSPCIAAFTPIEFGVETNKIAQCKISLSSSTTYEEMEYYFGDSNTFGYNHSQKMSLPNADTINSIASANESETGGLEIENNGRYELFVRCKSANGYYNVDPYQIKFCVDEGPDVTPPQIMEFSIADGSPVQYEVDEFDITVYVNEPSNCRWSRDNDLAFKDMENTMSCATNLWDMDDNLYYSCIGKLTGIKDREDNSYYFRCEDQPWMPQADRNPNSKGTKLTLKGTEPLNIDIDSIKPEVGDIVTGATTTVEVNLELATQNGANEGDATCYYSLNNNTFSEFKETGTHAHTQRQDLVGGVYNYYFQCIDAGGNAAYAQTNFEVYVDTEAPTVVRVLYNAASLELITDEDAECYYSSNENTKCNYNIGNSSFANQMRHKSNDDLTEHFATWDTETDYFVKCMDTNGKQPLPTQCSIIVRAVEQVVETE